MPLLHNGAGKQNFPSLKLEIDNIKIERELCIFVSADAWKRVLSPGAKAVTSISVRRVRMKGHCI